MAARAGVQRGAGVLASLLNIIGLLIVLVLVLYIGLTLLDANFGNSFAAATKNLADTFDLGMSNLFLPAQPKLRVALNYGVAAAVWFLITAIVVRLVRRLT